MPIEIRFFPTGCADAISVKYSNKNGDSGILLIDSGFSRTYPHQLKKYLQEIKSQNKKVSLWVITHTDNDHIGGILKFLRDDDFKNDPDFIQQYWFNWSPIKLPTGDDQISVKQGILLRDYLIKIGKHNKKDINIKNKPHDVEDAQITILSPGIEKLEQSKKKWKDQESSFIASKYDYEEPIDALLKKKFVEDNSPWNGGSIAFIFEFDGKRILFLADSHASEIVKTLKLPPFNCSSSNKLKIDLVKVSHHGSAGNTNDELLNLIDCRDFVFCVNFGNQHGLPNKECIARIIASREKEKNTTRLLFNDETPTFDQIFGIDNNPKSKYNFDFIHLKNGVWKIL